MSHASHHKAYSALDIEKYLKGQLTPAEMHAMEKAALEDPLLAEAMEGYAAVQHPVADDMQELNQRLEDRLLNREQAPIVPLQPAESKGSTPWWRVAAAVLLIGGLGGSIYYFGFADRSSQIAQSPSSIETKEEDNGKPNAALDSSRESTRPGLVDTMQLQKNDPASSVASKDQMEKEQSSTGLNYKTEEPVSNARPETSAPPVVSNNKVLLSDSMQPGAVAARKARPDDNPDGFIQNRSRSAEGMTALQKKKETGSDSIAPYLYDVAANNAVRYGNAFIPKDVNKYHIFRGKVVDANQQPLPFANITNTADNVGTYADANGNFILISPDSLMDVQVRSIGFENNRQQLKELAAGNLIKLAEDHSMATRVLDTTYRVVNLSRLNSLKFEEPEPVDGWNNYDTYVANNLKVPDDLRPKLPATATVQLSFEVDKLGQPVNIRIIRSLCGECDQEAIRLIREGPRWKPTGKRKRTNVTLSF